MIRCLLAMFALCCLPGPLLAAEWKVADGASLGFQGTYQGEAFEGRFERFRADLRFDADELDQAAFVVDIDLTSAATGNPDYDATLGEPEFFDTARFQAARFATSGFRQTSADGYEADAELTLRDRTRALVFPFRFERDQDQARLTATVVLQRLDYDVGNGEWADTGLIANDVEVRVDLPLLRVAEPAP